MAKLITSLMCRHLRCHKVDKLYEPKTWAFWPEFPFLRRISRIRRFHIFLRKLAKISLDYQCAKAFEAFLDIYKTSSLRPSHVTNIGKLLVFT